MTITTLTMERAHDAAMDGEATLPERPLRRTFTAAYKLAVLEEYEAAADDGAKGAILRREGLAETVNGLYKTELIRARGPWRTADQVELATAAWVSWWNEHRLHGACGDVPPAEFEAAYHQRLRATTEAA